MDFIHDETEIPSSRLNVITKISKWENYDYIERNGMKFIIGSSTEPKNKFNFQSINNINILIDLLVLKNKLQVQYTNNEKIISENITQYDIENIIKFCMRYGLPRWGEPPIYNCCINEQTKDNDMIQSTLFRPIIPFASENYLHLPSFIRALCWLKTDFLNVVASNNWDDDINVKPLLKEDDIQHLNSIRANQSKHGVSLYMPHLNPYVTYWDDKKMCLSLNCENLLHFAAYQLCLLQQAQDYTGGYIKECKKCGSLFVASHSNQQFCNNPCTRQSYYAQKKRIMQSQSKSK